MTRNKKITLSITGIILVTLILVGLTYGYYLTTIKGNTNTKSITTSLANLELKYDDGNGIITSSNLEPGDSVTKTFSVENTGNKKVVNYTVYLENVINEFIDKNDLKITLKCTSNNGTCNGNTLTYPSSDGIIAVNDIEEKEIQTFELKVDFIETNDLQNDNMNKKFEGNVKILDIKSTNKKLVTSEGENNATVSSPELLTNFKIYGNSLQNGIPTPNSPIEIESVGDKTENLIDYKQFTPYTKDGITFIENGLLYTGTYYISTTINNLIPENTYTLSFNIESTDEINPFWRFQYTDNTYSSPARNGIGIKIPADKIVKNVLLYPEVTATVHTSRITNIQLLLGDTVKDYERYGYKIPVKVSGKNLFDINTYFKEYLNNENEITYTQNDFAQINKIKILADVKENTQYTLSFDYEIYSSDEEKGNAISVIMKDKNNTDLKKVLLTSKGTKTTGNTKIVMDENTTLSYISITYATALRNCNVKLKNIQLEEGISPTKYEPYVEPEIKNIYLDEPLRKVGNYIDYIDLINKKVVRNIKLLELSENDNLVTTGISGSNYQGFALNGAQYNALKSDVEVYSNRFQYATEKKIIINSCSQTNATYGLRFVVSTDIVPNKSVNELKEYLKNNKTYIMYTLSASTEDPIEIPSIELTENTKKIFIETNTKPSNIEIGYIN